MAFGYLLLENGGYLLQENGGGILLEQTEVESLSFVIDNITKQQSISQ